MQPETTKQTPKWGQEHDAIVKEYKEAKAEGKVKEFVIVPKE